MSPYEKAFYDGEYLENISNQIRTNYNLPKLLFNQKKPRRLLEVTIRFWYN